MRWLSLVLLVADLGRAAPPPKAAFLSRILSPAESAVVAAPLLNLVTEVEAALGRAAGLRCVPAPRLGDGFDTSTRQMRRLFGAQVMPAGSVPRLSATMSCAAPGDGGVDQLIEVRLRGSAHAQDKANELPRVRGPIVARQSGVLIVERSDYFPGLTALVGSFEPSSADAGTYGLGRPGLMIDLGIGAVPFAAAIASELDRKELLLALQEIKPIPRRDAPEAEVPVTLSARERAETERAVVAAVLAWNIEAEQTIVQEPTRGSELASWAAYRELAPELRESLFTDFNSRRDSVVLPTLPANARFVSTKELRRVLKGPGDWEKFRKKYPGIPRVTRLSPVGLSADGKQALMYLDWRGGPLWGEGATYILVRSEDGWRVVYEIGRWMS